MKMAVSLFLVRVIFLPLIGSVWSCPGAFPSAGFVNGFVTKSAHRSKSISKKRVDANANTCRSIICTSGRRAVEAQYTHVITTSLYSSSSSAATASSDDDAATTAAAAAAVPSLSPSTKKPAASSAEEMTTVKRKKSWSELRKEGGPLTFNTPIGALNPFAMYYFFVSVVLGIPWFICCKFLQLIYWMTGNRFDPQRRIPIFIGHCWGMALLRLTRCYPEIQNREIVTNFFNNKKDEDTNKNNMAMFVANHCSWMDIPFLGAAMGWRNYKIVAKKELGIVPILGAAIRAGGHIMVDRTDRRSQVRTLKQGINYLKDGVNLATFPEGTRSQSGRMMNFQGGAFKMAHKAGATVIPLSIVNSHRVMPLGWMMAMRPAGKLAKVIVHPPISSDDKTEDELIEAVRTSMISGLPDDQKPLL